VPSHVVNAIQAQFPEMDYLPTRLPNRYRYLGWSSATTGYEIHYGPDANHSAITFQLAKGEQACGSYGSAMHTLHVNGKAVEWSATYNDQQAWRCLTTKGGQPFAISGSGSVPGDDNLSNARGLRDAQTLADLVAHAHPAS
jgi:hypothetical protein